MVIDCIVLFEITKFIFAVKLPEVFRPKVICITEDFKNYFQVGAFVLSFN